MLITLLVALIIIAVLYWALTSLPLPPIVSQIGVVILVLFSVLYLLGVLTGRHYLGALR